MLILSARLKLETEFTILVPVELESSTIDPLFLVDQNWSIGRAKEVLQSQHRLPSINQVNTITDYPLEADAIIKSLFELGVLLNGDVLNIL